MIQIAAYGRLGADPKSIQTKSGKAMAVGSLAVAITDRNEDSEPLWLGLVAFGRRADDLMRHKKGDLLSASGTIQRNSWTDRQTGEVCEQLQVIADSLVSARTVRPGGGKRKASKAGADRVSGGDLPFDDPIPAG